MDYMKLKLAIYESYGNGELTSEACSHLIDNLDEKYGESIAEEAANAENDFINASLKVFTESAGEEALTEAAKNFGAKIKAAWEKFKAWIKKIIEKILSLGKKPEQQKSKIQVPKALDKALSDAKKWIAKLGGAKTVGAMAAAVAGILSSTALIIKNRKLKETVGAKIYEYEKFKKEQADLVKDMQDAALNAQKEIENLKAKNTQLKNIGQDFADSNANLQTKLDNAEKRLAVAEAKAKADVASLDRKNDNQKQTIGEQQIKISDQKDEIEKLKKEVEDLKKQISDAKKSKPENQKKVDNASGENVTDSKIISASTGLVNAVTKTVAGLLPQYSSKTIDDMDAKIPTRVTPLGIIQLTEQDNPDMRILMDESSSIYWAGSAIRNYINNLSTPKATIAYYLKKYDEIGKEVYKSVGDISSPAWKVFENRLNSKYNLDTNDGVNAFVHDYSNGTGEISSFIKDAINEAKKATSYYQKYKSMSENDHKFDQNKVETALKDYRESDTAANNAAVMKKTIEFMIHDLKKKTHKYKEDII